MRQVCRCPPRDIPPEIPLPQFSPDSKEDEEEAQVDENPAESESADDNVSMEFLPFGVDNKQVSDDNSQAMNARDKKNDIDAAPAEFADDESEIDNDKDDEDDEPGELAFNLHCSWCSETLSVLLYVYLFSFVYFC